MKSIFTITIMLMLMLAIKKSGEVSLKAHGASHPKNGNRFQMQLRTLRNT